MELLSQAPRLRILVTSRERLNLRAEHIFELEGLMLEDEGGLPASALRLFEARARQVQHRFALTPETLPAVEAICRQVEGSPLGIELAATWADRLSPATIVRTLQSGADALSTSMRDVPERHRSMRAVFEHSWQLLAQSERQTLARLAVFPSSFDLEAVLAITQGEIGELSRLVQTSLVRCLSEDRYQLPALVRCFALERLHAGQAGCCNEIYQRHSAYYLRQIVEVERTASDEQAPAATAEDRENIEQAWQWAHQHGYTEELALKPGRQRVVEQRERLPLERAALASS